MTSAHGAPFILAIEAPSLFDLAWAHQILRSDGPEVYREIQTKHEDEPLSPGRGFEVTRRLLALNPPRPAAPLVEVALVSTDHAEAGVRLLNSARHYGLPLGRTIFTGGRSLFPYLRALHVDLFIADHFVEAETVVFPAARVYPHGEESDGVEGQLRVAFDSASAFFTSTPGREPFIRVLTAVGRLQRALARQRPSSPLRTALVTTGDSMSDVRVTQELRQWQITLDESFFVPAGEQEEVLAVYRPHLWFSGDLHATTTSEAVDSSSGAGAVAEVGGVVS